MAVTFQQLVRVLRGFFNSQHRPVIINIGLKIAVIHADLKNRWNFTKADWASFSRHVDQTISRIPPVASNYARFMKLVRKAAAINIPRGHRKSYIPGWTEENQTLYDQFRDTGDIQISKALLSGLDKTRKEEWETKMNSLSFTKSSKKAWGFVLMAKRKIHNESHLYRLTRLQLYWYETHKATFLHNRKDMSTENI